MRIIVLLIMTMFMAGCSSGYSIQGRVVRGSVAAIQVVDGDDVRMSEANPTGGGALVMAVLEPDTPTETKALGRHITDGQGRFSIPVDAFGSGVLEYEVQIVARREGHQGAMAKINLPRGSKRVLITLPLGRDTLVVPEDYLDRTLRDADPYLNQSR